jgi:NAD(P)H-hydrate epimerase
MQDVTASPLTKLASREADSHKGDYGRALIIGGSRGMAGAPALAGKAALRSGAGLVTLAVPRSIQSTVASFEPSYMTIGFGNPEDDALSLDSRYELSDCSQLMTVVAVGPGLHRIDELHTSQLVQELYAELACPMVVDADGLNAVAANLVRLKSPGGPRILTPHPGEFQRLAGEPVDRETDKRADQAARLCNIDTNGQTIVVLKGHRTIVTDGRQYAVNQTGNPGMATGGTGDCLTGIITALVAQGLSPWNAARLGVHVHGLAGDLAADQLGQVALIASDLVDFLPAAFQQLDV